MPQRSATTLCTKHNQQSESSAPVTGRMSPPPTAQHPWRQVSACRAILRLAGPAMAIARTSAIETKTGKRRNAWLKCGRHMPTSFSMMGLSSKWCHRRRSHRSSAVRARACIYSWMRVACGLEASRMLGGRVYPAAATRVRAADICAPPKSGCEGGSSPRRIGALPRWSRRSSRGHNRRAKRIEAASNMTVLGDETQRRIATPQTFIWSPLA